MADQFSADRSKLVGEETMAKTISKITGFDAQNEQLMSVWKLNNIH